LPWFWISTLDVLIVADATKGDEQLDWDIEYVVSIFKVTLFRK